MRYTPAQVKEALEITEETLRYWRQKLPPLKGKKGYAPCFSPGDLLALKVVTQIHGLGVNVGELVSHSVEFFKACSQGAWFGLEDKVLVFDGQTMELVSASEEGSWAQQTRIAVPLGPLIRQLRQRLSEEESSPAQPEIVFPPLGVAQGRSK
ncbi:MerR family transcriptional regulator [Thermomonas sp. HDW16]|uniref:MerR family transcriptional regulator n=1 Tax=Thermomonas sp. HDW16 TaxID=2714945 RepID=UPI00140E03B8|nr:MerR family transcriptional regulator [Thermomonas sp. HDW16]QIL19749.1 MerR family transcriptional regulator [Thermomonas sp. HDW16]